MRLSLLAFLLSGAACVGARAQGVPLTGTTPQSFVTSNFRLVPGSLTTGDLNGDGRPDAALVLAPAVSSPGTDANAEPERSVIVVWGQAGGGYRLGLTTEGAIRCATCGGALGDPLEKLTITKGVLSIVHRGGSRERWRSVAKFRYQQGDFYQIGDTYDVVDDASHACPKLAGGYRSGSEHRDVNLLTGQYERVQVSADCQFVENRRGRQPVKPLVRLLDYKPQP